MWPKMLVFLTVFGVFSSSRAFHHLLPSDKELIYDWKAEVKAGTYLPARYVSQFALEGKIHLQKSNSTVFGKITDLAYKTYHGVLDHMHENEHSEVSVPEEVENLGETFEVVYNHDGLVEKIVTKAEEKEFSRNIKRAIAGIFQLKESVLSEGATSFTVEENSVHGFGDVDYTVYAKNGGLEVHKVQDLSRAGKSMLTNGEFERCDIKSEEIVTQDSGKKYTLVKSDKSFIVKNISTTGTIVYYPFRGQSDAQYVKVDQSFHLSDVAPLGDKYHVDGETSSSNLTYNQFLKSQDGRNHDFTNGRHTIDSERLILDTQKVLEEIPKFLSENHINGVEPDGKNAHLVNRAQSLLQQFNLKELQLLQKSLDEETLEIFYHVLPLVDTDASKLLIKNLIVTKATSDETAVKLLQNMEHYAGPSLLLLEKLEELIHLNDTYNWDVRKVAILRFASLIHKSYVDLKVDKLYDKYVKEYISKMKDSTDYEVQQVYIFGLHNMKLPSIVKHLRPAFNGDQNLRYLSLWAAAASDSEEIFDILWSMFINTEEETEMRTLAYVYIMKTRPSLSRLRTMSNYMLKEPNEEVYSFYYSYLKTVMESKEPCLRELRQSLAQIIKFAPPPKYGVSTAETFGYSDVSVGFGTNFGSYFTKANRSLIYSAFLENQQFGRYQEEYSVYVKIRDNKRKHLFPTRTILDTLYYFFSDVKKINNVEFAEGAILRRGQIINAYYFKGKKADIASSLIKRLLAQPKKLMEMLHINYHNYDRSVMPTDVGLPVFWEYLKPALYRNKLLSLSKNYRSGLTFEFDIDSRFTNSFHYRHGLSFYNPINNMWQGVNRYHFFDMTVPIRMKISTSVTHHSLNLTWTKSSDDAGLRSYVKQVVFLRDSLDEEESVTVDLGEHYRHNYTFIDREDLDTGLKIHVSAFDSNRRKSNGSLIRQLFLFAQSETKHYSLPLEHIMSVAANLLTYTALLPEPGIYGVVAKIELSPKFAVSGTQLSVRYKLDYEKHIPYVPDYRGNVFATYSVNNTSGNLLTWVANASIHAHRGHSNGTVDVELTRIVPGEKTYKICANASKKFTQDRVRGGLYVTMGRTETEECPTESVLDLLETGARSPDQEDGSHRHGSCQNVVPYSWKNYHTLQCLVSQNTIGYYHYDIVLTKMPEWFNDLASLLWGYFTSYYKMHYTYKDADVKISDNEIKADITFPIDSPDEFDLEVQNTGRITQLTGVSNTYWSFYGLFPKLASYSILFLFYEKSGYNDHLRMYPDHHYFNDQLVQLAVPSKWTKYLQVSNDTSVYVKLVKNNALAVRIDSDGHTVKIIPIESKYEIYKDGKLQPLQEQHIEDWLYYHVFKYEPGRPLVVFLPITGVHLEYFLDRIEFSVPGSTQYISLT